MRKVLLRSLSMLTAIMMLLLSPAKICAEAHAAAEASAALHESIVQEFIAAILARSGVTFKNGGSLLSVAAMVYDDLKNADLGEVQQNIDDFMNSLNPANWNLNWDYAEQLTNQMAIRVSPTVWQAICDAFNAHRLGDMIFSGWSGVYTLPYASIPDFAPDIVDYFDTHILQTVRVNGDLYSISILDNRIQLYKNGVKQSKSVYWYGDQYRFGVTFVDWSDVPYASLGVYSYIPSKGRWTGDSFLYNSESKQSITLSYPLGSESFTGSLAYPPDNTLVKVPDLPTVGADGAITMPDIPVLPEEYVVSDLPETAGKVVTDLPFDVPIDIVTGDSVVVGTIPDVPDKPVNPDLPSNADLSLPQLIITKFPFCIPFDLAHMIGLLAADPVEPVFRIPIKARGFIDEEIVLDFSQFSDLIAIIRWGEYIVFVGGLALVTRNYIKW